MVSTNNLPPKPDKRIPALPPDRLKLFMNVVSQRFARHIADGIAQVMQAATDPNAESAESAIRELHPARRQAVESHIRELDGHFSAIGRRGTEALAQVAPKDWQALFDESSQ